jgi:hypothetical protein
MNEHVCSIDNVKLILTNWRLFDDWSPCHQFLGDRKSLHNLYIFVNWQNQIIQCAMEKILKWIESIKIQLLVEFKKFQLFVNWLY